MPGARTAQEARDHRKPCRFGRGQRRTDQPLGIAGLNWRAGSASDEREYLPRRTARHPRRSLVRMPTFGSGNGVWPASGECLWPCPTPPIAEDRRAIMNLYPRPTEGGVFDERASLSSRLPLRSALAKLDPASVPRPAVEQAPLPGAPVRSRGGRRARRRGPDLQWGWAPRRRHKTGDGKPTRIG